MFTVSIESDRRLVRSCMAGLLTMDEVGTYERAQQAAVRATGWRDGGYDHLVEFEGDVVQQQDVIESFGRLLMKAPLKARRVALVRTGALARLQIRRLSQVRAECEVFPTLPEAEAWLARA